MANHPNWSWSLKKLQKHKKMKKTLRIALIVLCSIAAILLIVNVLAGPITKSYVEKHDKELLGRELTVDKLRVNIFGGKLKISDLVLFEDDGITPFVSLEGFETKVRLRDLTQHRLFIKKVLLSGLKVNIEQDRTWFNFNSLVDHFRSDEPKPEKKESSGFGLIFNDINLENSRIRYADLSVGSEFLLRNISLRVPYVDLSNLKSKVGLDLILADSATLHTDLHLSENAEEYFINLKLNGLGIDIIEPYLQQSLAVDSLQGRIDMALSAQGRTEHILDFDLTGDIALSDLSLQDTLGNRLGHIDSIMAQIGRFNLNQNLLDFERVYLTGLSTAYVVNADSTSNFALFTGGKKYEDTTVFEKVIDTIAAEIEHVQERKTLKINVQDLQLANMHLSYEDHTLPDVFKYDISDISLTAKDFNLNADNAVKLQAKLNQTGRLNMIWQGNLHGLENHDLTLMLNNVKFTDFSPYAMQWFGHPLENGTLSFHSQNKITNGALEGINKVQVASPQVGDKLDNVDAPYGKVPLKLGFYLLTDKNNNANLDLPISGNLNDPKFSYRKALLKVLGNLLVKVATSPFRLLASDDDLQFIPFDVLQSDFTASEYAMIDEVVATLYTHPDMGVVLEEKVQYENTVQHLCNMQLQRDYYLYSHPEIDSTGIDFLTNESIRSIKLNDKGLCDFAAQYSEKRKLHSKKDVASVAWAVYHERSEQLVPRLMARRSEQLSHYLHDIKGLSPEQVTVTLIDDSLMRSYDKPSRYELHVVEYEVVEESLND